MSKTTPPAPGQPRTVLGTVLATLKVVLIVPILGFGLMVFVGLIATRPEPVLEDRGEIKRRVRVIEVAPVAVVPRAIGHGSVSPGKTWTGVAQIRGRVRSVHPDLKRGAIIRQGSELASIDATRYELAVRRVEAQIEAIRARRTRIDVNEANQRSSIAIEERSIEFARSDLQRLRTLLQKDAASKESVEKQEREVLRQETAIQTLRNQLNLLPAERAILDADLKEAEIQLADAREDLKWTTIVAPFDGRVSRVSVETTQYVQVGQELVVLDELAVAEIGAEITIDRLRPLLPPDAVVAFDRPDFDPAEIWTSLAIEAIVRLRLRADAIEWQAKLVRTSDTIDPKSRTMAVIVQVEDSYRQAIPGVRPPLVKGMFCEVELRGKPRPGSIVIPRSALHGQTVHIIEDGRLASRKVVIAYRLDDVVVVESGLEVGQMVVVSDVAPAIEGILLEGEVDRELTERMLAEAVGR